MKNATAFKTLRHIETVRNYINVVIKELLNRQETHDQSKLQSPEIEVFDKYTPLLRNVTYGSEEYKELMKPMEKAIHHHNANNKHHPEHYLNGIQDMTLIDLIEMICDWKSSSLRHNDGNILKSIDLNQQRFGYTDELRQIFKNTVLLLETKNVSHQAQES
jgi:hypothetical protein